MQLEITHFFDASHQLPDSIHLCTKACARMHGHTYKVKVLMEGDNSRNGMVIDFKVIKDAIDVLDHRHINDIFEEYKFNVPATAENIAIFLADHIETLTGDRVKSIAIAEGYKGEEKASWAIYKPKDK